MNQSNNNLEQIYSPMRCVSANLLLKYVNNKLNDKDAHAVERHLVDCPFCEDALEGILLSGTDQFSVMLSDVNAAIATRIDAVQEQAEEKAPEVQPTRILNSAKPKSSRRLYMSIAASIMLLATIGFFVLGSSPTPQTIAEEYFQVFELGQTRAATSTSEGAYDQAKVLYQNKKFAEAAPLFDQVNSIKALYSAANCYYLLGKYDLASSRFRAVIDRGDGYAEDAEFGLAMTYLMQDKVEQADELLSNISQDNRHNYSLMAKDALEEIEHL